MKRPAPELAERLLDPDAALARELHDVGNALAAARLRTELLMANPQWPPAQAESLRRLHGLLCEGLIQSEQLETRIRRLRPRPGRDRGTKP
jgi:hypothetical protein